MTRILRSWKYTYNNSLYVLALFPAEYYRCGGLYMYISFKLNENNFYEANRSIVKICGIDLYFNKRYEHPSQ